MTKSQISKQLDLKSCRDGFGEALLELGKNNKDVVVVSADLAESTRCLDFGKKYPQRFVEVGVAEQNMAGVAAGLALEGLIPFMCSFAVFSPGRNWEQIRISICYNKANVKLVSSHAGLNVGEDGATHQGLEDIALMRVLPNMVVIAPCDYLETKKAVMAVVKYKGQVYIRYGREKTPVITSKQSKFQIGKAEILRQGKDVTIVACGPMVYEALMAAEELAKQKISAEVINCHTIKPIDKATIIKSAKKTKKVITIEEHQVNGGLGSAVAEVLSQNYPVPIKILGMPDKFGESGSSNLLLAKYNLNSEGIIYAIKKSKTTLHFAF
ncbi:MAG: transketolase [Candidatus Buchananbacteria bacterium RBG_13_36_9]|uniref:Transketolase n=1 Tax=Candidatus Buchananbacteria bacterium RBG_13_36_9 TaxID=1797530 RepID=A0A1G1XRW7_9BACT|nr:MAG: transketolase [Candidatus Buchananbacteria bacterium RBG_13_36_9]